MAKAPLTRQGPREEAQGPTQCLTPSSPESYFMMLQVGSRRVTVGS